MTTAGKYFALLVLTALLPLTVAGCKFNVDTPQSFVGSDASHVEDAGNPDLAPADWRRGDIADAEKPPHDAVDADDQRDPVDQVVPPQCTSDDECWEIRGEVDLNECATWVCDEELGACVEEDLDDETPCDVENKCVASVCHEGICEPGEEMQCDDENPCTKDKCNPESGECEYLPAEAECEDGDLCTVGDWCEDGMCQTGEPLNCEDGNDCSEDACEFGECVHGPLVGCCNEDGDCEDKPCSLAVCEGNECQYLGQENCCELDEECDDNNPCTAGICADGGCAYDAVDAVCNDNNKCTVNDVCSGGFCQGVPKNCEDKPCNKHMCDQETGACIYEPEDGLVCTDNNKCTTGDKCLEGQCVSTGSLWCGDFTACTDNFCDPDEGCFNVPVENGKECTDLDKCTDGDQCDDGECVGKQIDCDDADPCTDDTCHAATGCKYLAAEAGTPCNDGNPCTLGEQCFASFCVGGEIKSCKDNDPCTEDYCDPDQGCVHKPMGEGCCTKDDDCLSGDPCLTGYCAENGACAFVETICPDLNPGDCIINECVDGVCVEQEDPDCGKCADVGQTLSFDSNKPCCDGLKKMAYCKPDPTCPGNECPPCDCNTGLSICLFCGDNICDQYEDECTCPDDCGSTGNACEESGGYCTGQSPDGAYKCEDGFALMEDELACDSDMKELCCSPDPDCADYGEIVYNASDQCCPDLAKMPYKTLPLLQCKDQVGSICLPCGDDICDGEKENKCTCANDCIECATNAKCKGGWGSVEEGFCSGGQCRACFAELCNDGLDNDCDAFEDEENCVPKVCPGIPNDFVKTTLYKLGSAPWSYSGKLVAISGQANPYKPQCVPGFEPPCSGGLKLVDDPSGKEIPLSTGDEGKNGNCFGDDLMKMDCAPIPNESVVIAWGEIVKNADGAYLLELHGFCN